MIKYCKRCFYPSNHALGLIINKEGLCSGCEIHEEKDFIDWDKKWIELRELTSSYINTTNNNYDCIIPVSGGKDSYFIVDTIVNKLKLKPLLVSYNSQYMTPVAYRNISNLKIKFGVDLIQKTVDPRVVKNITRATFSKYGSIYWHVIAGETAFPVQISVQLKIPLIIWGAHQGLDQVGMYRHNDYVEMSRKYRKDHDLFGIEAEDLVSEDLCISDTNISPFKYPSDNEIEKVGVRGIYLNNYIRWDSRSQHEYVSNKYNYEGANQNRSFDKFSNIDCYMYSDVHDYIKFIKHGYSKINDHIARELRLGHMDKKDVPGLIKNYLYNKPKNLNYFLNWIGMKETGFWFIIDQIRNKKFFKRNSNWEWIYINGYNTFSIDDYKDDYDFPDQKKFINYKIVNKKSDDKTDRFLLIGKGYK